MLYPSQVLNPWLREEMSFASDLQNLGLKNELMKSMFPLNEASDRCNMQTRNREKFKVTHCKTNRLQNSAIPFMQNLLNTELQDCKK